MEQPLLNLEAHENVFMEPNVKALAQELQIVLAEAQTQTTAANS